MKILTWMSFGMAAAVSCLLLIVPTYTTSSTTIAEHPVNRSLVEQGHTTMLLVNGPSVLLALAIPVLIALTPLVFPTRAMHLTAAIAIAVFCLLGGFSIGLFYIPSAVLIAVAGLLRAYHS